ncbi:MAG: methyltransferase domain-containing protein [Promethearchaeota archaeon]
MKDNYYYWASYRRKMLDLLQERYKDLYMGIVLDIGGRDRGQFKKPKDKVEKWIFADINENHKPDMVLDVMNMNSIDEGCIDVVNAIELFEHVKDVDKGLKECFRVLKYGGKLILSSPFLIHLHADPFDFQRFTYLQWKKKLENVGFEVLNIIIMGRYFTHFSEMIKDLLKAGERRRIHGSTLFLKIIHPFLDRIRNLDQKSFIKNDPRLKNYHTGYFIIARKK